MIQAQVLRPLFPFENLPEIVGLGSGCHWRFLGNPTLPFLDLYQPICYIRRTLSVSAGASWATLLLQFLHT
jgi:hypothetical protein